MKKTILVALTCMLTFIQGCSKINDDLAIPEENVSEINLPQESEEYGKAVAKELRGIVLNLNKQGTNYSIMGNMPFFKTKFYQDVYQASPSTIKTKSSTTTPMLTPDLAERYSNLSSIQIDYISKITKEVNKSNSFRDLKAIISNLNKDIYKNVPKIEQERLYNVTAVLYYGLQEIQKLEKEGQMLSLSNTNLRSPRLKSWGEDDDSFGDSCRKFLTAGWVIAVGEPTPGGEIVMSVATVVIAGILLYEVITCKKTDNGNPNQGYCQLKFANCSSPIPNGCSICLQYCLTQGVWPPYNTHKCS